MKSLRQLRNALWIQGLLMLVVEMAAAGVLEDADAYIQNQRRGPAILTLSVVGSGAVAQGTSIRVELRRHEFNFGTCVSGTNQYNTTWVRPEPPPGGDDYEYQQFIDGHFNMIVPANAGKWPFNERQRDVVDMSTLDAILDYADLHHLRARMTTAFWGWESEGLAWVDALKNEANKWEYRAEMTERIQYYLADRAHRFINVEGINEEAKDRYPFAPKDIHTELFGIQGVADIYDEMAAAAGDTEVFVNEYHIIDPTGIERALYPMSEWYRNYVQSILDHGGTVGGLGLQCHTANARHDPDFIDAILDDLACRFARPMMITEFSGREANPAVLTETMRLAFGHPHMIGFVMWGFWEPELPEFGDPDPYQCELALVDENWNLTPSGQAYEQLMAQWDTDQTLVVNGGSQITLSAPGFYGDYDVTIAGTNDRGSFTLVNGSTAYNVSIVPAALKASNPTPADGERGVDPNADLSWTAGTGATSHRVYFGTTVPGSPGTFRGEQAGTTFDPGVLDLGTYYWRIDEVSAAYGTITGEVWRFTVGGAWDFTFLGDQTLQELVVGTGSPTDPATWGPDPNWLGTSNGNDWRSSVGSGAWSSETVAPNGGAQTPDPNPRYLNRYDDNTDPGGQKNLWGARFALDNESNPANRRWHYYDWSKNNPDGKYPSETDSTHKFTLVFRMKNLGSRRYTPDFVNRDKCLLEVGSKDIYKRRDHLYAIFQQDIAEGGPYRWIFNSAQDGRNHLGGEYQCQAQGGFEVYRLTGECSVWSDTSSHTGYREGINMRLYQNEDPDPVQELNESMKQADYNNDHYNYADAQPFFRDIMFRFPKTGGDEMQQYLIDYVAVKIGEAWAPGEGGLVPPPTPPEVPPPTPGPPIASTNLCGDKTLTRNGTPPSGVTWYWQDTSCGTRQDLGSGATYVAVSSGIYYTRAQDDSSGLWSDGCGSVAVTVNHPTVAADLDDDCDVDHDDLALFEGCATGPEVGLPAGECGDADLDGDNDVDHSDFGLFQRCVSGSGLLANPDCEQ